MLVSAPHAQADVIPDGSTATTRTLTEAGLEQLKPAAADSLGASYNRYTQFNVGPAGVEFDNSETAAKTIVNEVTGSQRSTLQGPIEITGARANFILANPNGITVDGTRFINTGRVALGAGHLQQQNNTQGNPIPQLTVSTATLDVQAGGLSGVMSSLHLLANQLNINGPVNNQSAEATAGFALIAGGSVTQFDPSLSPIRSDEWASITVQAQTETALAVDIQTGASLHGGKVQVMVTNHGAGVRHAGDWVAEDEFTLSADGAVEITGAVTSTQALHIQAQEINLHTPQDTQTNAQTSLLSGGALTLQSTQGDVSIIGAAVQGKGADHANGVEINAANNIILKSTDADHLGILFSEQGDLSLSGNALSNDTGRLISNGNININASKRFETFTSVTSVPHQGEFVSEKRDGKRLWYTLFSRRETIEESSINYGELIIPNQIAYLSAQEGIQITAPLIRNTGSDVNANGGNIELTADEIKTEALIAGFAHKKTECSFACDVSGYSNIALYGGRWQAAGQINAVADNQISNTGGQWLGLQGMNLTSPNITATAIPIYSFISRPKGLSGLFGMDTGTLMRIDQGGIFYANMGELTIHSVNAPIADGGLFRSDQAVNSDVAIHQVRQPFSEAAVIVDEIGIVR